MLLELLKAFLRCSSVVPFITFWTRLQPLRSDPAETVFALFEFSAWWIPGETLCELHNKYMRLACNTPYLCIMIDRPPAASSHITPINHPPPTAHRVCFYAHSVPHKMPPTFPALPLGKVQQSFPIFNESGERFHAGVCRLACSLSHVVFGFRPVIVP